MKKGIRMSDYLKEGTDRLIKGIDKIIRKEKEDGEPTNNRKFAKNRGYNR